MKLLTLKIHQEELSNPVKHQIEAKLASLPELCHLLESLYTAADFLMQAGGNPNDSLGTFLVKLKMHCSPLYNLSFSGKTSPV